MNANNAKTSRTEATEADATTATVEARTAKVTGATASAVGRTVKADATSVVKATGAETATTADLKATPREATNRSSNLNVNKMATKNSLVGKAFRMMAAAATVIASMAVCSCQSGVAYDEYVSIAKTGWDKDTLAVFRTDMSDSTDVYDIMVQVRNDNSYAYSNLWLFIDVIAPDGVSRRDTLECILARTDGSWLGSGWGSLYNETCPYMTTVKFSKPGPYTFRITQGMRADELAGIHDIGLLIQKSQLSQDE